MPVETKPQAADMEEQVKQIMAMLTQMYERNKTMDEKIEARNKAMDEKMEDERKRRMNKRKNGNDGHENK